MKRCFRKFVGALVALLISLLIAWVLFVEVMTSSYGRQRWSSPHPTPERPSEVRIGGMTLHGGKPYYYERNVGFLLGPWGLYLTPVSFLLSLYYGYLCLKARTEAIEEELDRREKTARPA